MTKKLLASKHETLPQSLIESEILARLRCETLQRCKLVSKSWLKSITEPGFAVFHTKHVRDNTILVFSDLVIKVFRIFNVVKDTKLDLAVPSRIPVLRLENYVKQGVFGFAGTCNGLICFYIRYDNKFEYHLYNPTLQIVRLLHVLHTQDGIIGENFSLYEDNKEGHGLGFDLKNNDYKCVTILRHGTYVFSTKTGTIKKIKDNSFTHKLIDNIGVQAKNCLHWIYGTAYGIARGMLTLDPETDLFYETPLPCCKGRPRIMTIRGDLHVVYSTYVKPPLHNKYSKLHNFSYEIGLWLMKGGYGFSKSCWIELYNVRIDNMPFSTIPISFLEGGRKVLLELWKDKSSKNKKSYRWYDLVTKESEECLDVQGHWNAYPCLETLINPCYV
ncbi:F-box/kelch-repeat protein At3g23880-like [Silene latifolia]|uniref:F-box/kelch-repeat protein At3g23880-like n=1 Tax=Silene latifolia TaxID=37657 RepID=UPI003D787EEC